MSDTRELRAALEKAQARLKILESERKATGASQAERDELRLALAAAQSRITRLEAEMAPLRAKAGRPESLRHLVLVEEVKRLREELKASRPATAPEVARLRGEVNELEKELTTARRGRGHEVLEQEAALVERGRLAGAAEVKADRDRLAVAVDHLAAEHKRLSGALVHAKTDRDALAAELTAIKAKLKEITTERNQLRAYAPRR